MTLTVLNPATEEPIAELEQAGVAETEEAVARAKEAFPSWRAVAPRDRARLLRRLATLVEETNAEELAQIESRNVGKPISGARGEIEAIVFERNPEYHTPTSIQYVTHLIDPGGSWISRYEDGTLDILYLDVESTERVRREDSPLHDEWKSGPSMCTTFVGMNNILPPFDDPLVRKAFALAVNREILNVRLANNLNIIGQTLLPPGMPGYSENLSMIYDPAAAKQALDESSYAGNLPEVRMEAGGFASDNSPVVR